MNTFASENGDGKAFVSHAPGYWPDTAPELWNDWRWQLKNRVTTLAQLEKHLELSSEERSGVLLSGDKLALAVTPHFFNLLPANDPDIDALNRAPACANLRRTGRPCRKATPTFPRFAE